MAESAPTVRARIGLIIPSSNRLSEPQFHEYAPPGVQINITRLRMTGPYSRPVLELLPKITEAAELLADAACDLIVFHCTASSMESGRDAERQVLDTITSATGRPATSTGSALLEALRALDVRKLVMVSPYNQTTNDHESAFLAEAGIRVLHDRPLNLGGSDGYIAAPPALWKRVTIEERDPDADGYLLSCTNIHSLPVITEIEVALDKPVIASNQAVLWYGLRSLGLNDRVPALGRLFRVGLKEGVPA
jgi:maleate isomerase